MRNISPFTMLLAALAFAAPAMAADPTVRAGVEAWQRGDHAAAIAIWQPLAGKNDAYALFNLGASTEFGSVTGFIAGSATAGRTDGNYWAVTVGVRMPL